MQTVNKYGHYHGVRVFVTSRERIPGGVAVWVERPSDSKDWPYSMTAFSTAESNIEYEDQQ